MELDPVDQLDPEAETPATGRLATGLREWRAQVPTPVCFSSPRLLVRFLRRSGSAWTAPFNSRAPTRGPGHPARSRAVLLVTLIATALMLGVATYGVVTNRTNAATVGLAGTAVTAVAMAFSAGDSIRTGERSCELLDRALAESERARDELHVANAKLQRRNADLRALQLAVVQGFDLIDERTQGRLQELVEEAGDEFAALVDEALDGPTEGA